MLCLCLDLINTIFNLIDHDLFFNLDIVTYLFYYIYFILFYFILCI